jgi:hypothetical protein
VDAALRAAVTEQSVGRSKHIEKAGVEAVFLSGTAPYFEPAVSVV